MNIMEFLNANISKKWGLALGAMYFITQTENVITAWQVTLVAGIAIIGQCLIDWKHNEKDTPTD